MEKKHMLSVAIIVIVLCALCWCEGDVSTSSKIMSYYEHIEIMWDGVVVFVSEDGGTVYVMVDELGDDLVVEVDVYERLIHTNIDVGDRAYFLVDALDPHKWKDADLIAIEKGNEE